MSFSLVSQDQDLKLINEVLVSANGFELPQLTQAQIVALGPNAPNGTMWYCTDSTPPNVVVKINGSLVQLSTVAFP